MKRPQKALVVGIDGAVISLVEKHIAEGVLPNFARVFQQGTQAKHCLCPMPTITPPNWTCISTGAWPITHQITDYWRHIPGTTPTAANIDMNFSGERIKAETIFEAAERAGKKSIVVNYPTSWGLHKRLKNSIVVGGSGLTVGTLQDNEIAERLGAPKSGGQVFCDDLIINSEILPGGVQVHFKKAQNWENVDNLGNAPQEFTFDLLFAKTPFKVKKHTWHILVRDMDDDGYDTITIAPNKNLQNAFCTLKVGEWSKRIFTKIAMEDGSFKEVAFLAKLIKLSDDAEDFSLLISQMLNTDGEYWIYPPEKAAVLRDIEAVPTTKAGFLMRMLGWFEDDTFMEMIRLHNKWLGETLLKLMSSEDWSVCFFHTHPTDSIYHYMMTELDPSTCSSQKAHEHAWEFHRQLYISTDAMLGKLLDAIDDETLVVMVSDHGSKADGAAFSPVVPLVDAGLMVVDETQDVSDIIKATMKNLSPESAENMRKSNLPAVISKSKAFPQRVCYVYVNLKGRYPGGVVEPEDYYKVQREIIDALYGYIDPVSGKRPVALALTKEDARIIGMGGEQCGDVVYAVHPEYNAQHGPILSTAKWSIGDLNPMGVFYGPGIKKGYKMERTMQIVDIVPTICYMLGLPVPTTCEGSVVYQAMEDPDFYNGAC